MVKGTEKRAIENKIKRYNDYQSAGLITFLISSTQHLPLPLSLKNKSISKYLTYIVYLKVKEHLYKFILNSKKRNNESI